VDSQHHGRVITKQFEETCLVNPLKLLANMWRAVTPMHAE